MIASGARGVYLNKFGLFAVLEVGRGEKTALEGCGRAIFCRRRGVSEKTNVFLNNFSGKIGCFYATEFLRVFGDF